MKILQYCAALLIALAPSVSMAKEPPSREEAFRLANQVRKCFRMPLNQTGNAVIEFRLHKDGKATDVELVKSGGFTNYIVGLAAMEAVKKCQPYKTSIVGKVRVPFIFKSDTPTPERAAP
ncbi:energy transducer TonB family protein [Brucella lupini]